MTRPVSPQEVSDLKPRFRIITPAAVAVCGVLGGLAFLTGVEALASWLQGGTNVLSANDPDPESDGLQDADGDGLIASFEWVLRSNDALADTDGDGYSDLEEFARGSSLFWALSTPLPGEFSTQLTVRKGDGKLHVLMATYVVDGNFTDYAQSLGMRLDDVLVSMPPGYVSQHGTTSIVPTSNGSAVRLFELPIRENLIHDLGGVTFFGTLARASTGTVISAAVSDVRSEADELFLRTKLKNRPSQRSDLRAANSPPGGSIYVPLPPPGQIPSTWSAGQICRQMSTVIGVADGVVTREITDGECVEAFDSFCKSDCTMSVGNVEKTVDPLSLIGG